MKRAIALLKYLAATSWAANIAAYGEASSRSAFTFIPPVIRTIVSLRKMIVKIRLHHTKSRLKNTPLPSKETTAAIASYSKVYSLEFFVQNKGKPLLSTVTKYLHKTATMVVLFLRRTFPTNQWHVRRYHWTRQRCALRRKHFHLRPLEVQVGRLLQLFRSFLFLLAYSIWKIKILLNIKHVHFTNFFLNATSSTVLSVIYTFGI